MSINVNDKNLGHATAYAYYKAGGGTMTEAEFTEFMADFGTASQTAVEAAQAALASKNAAQTAATTATNKASEATTAATTATTKAAEAQADADAAALDASQAMSAASTATTKATEATTAAATATSAKTDAVAANTAAQSAKTAAQTAQTGAETAAASVQSSAAQITQNTSDISELKEDITQTTLQIFPDWEQGNIRYQDGVEEPSTAACRTVNFYIPSKDTVMMISNPNTQRIILRKWQADGTFDSSVEITSYASIELLYGYKYKIVDIATGTPSSVTATFTVKSELSIDAVRNQISDVKEKTFNTDNLLIMSDLIEGQYYNTKAVASSDSSFFKVPVSSGKTYKFGSTARYVSKDGVILASAVTTYTVSTNDGDFLYISFYNSARDDWAMCESTIDINTVGTYDKPVAKPDFVKEVTQQIISIESEVDDVEDYAGYVNFVPTFIDGAIISKSTGAYIETSSYSATDYIDVNEYGIYNIYSKCGNDASGYAFYDADKNYIWNSGGGLYDSGGGTKFEVTAPRKAKYVRYSCLTNHLSGSRFETSELIKTIKNNVNKSIDFANTPICWSNKVNPPYWVFLLDTARKYFTIANIKTIIDLISAAGFNQFMMHLSTDSAFRIELDDMEFTIGGNTYDLSTCLGGAESATSWYDQDDMDEIISYCHSKNIDFVPLFDMPGHMGKILSVFTQFRYTGTTNMLDITNESAINFAKAIVDRYTKYFASRGCNCYNMGYDELPNLDADSETNGFQDLYAAGNYDYVTNFGNAIADIIHKNGLIPRIFNEAVYFEKDYKYQFCKDFEVMHWYSQASDGNASAQDLQNHNYKLINTSFFLYWILGNSERSTTVEYINSINLLKNFYGGTLTHNAFGASLCAWCDAATTVDAGDGGDSVVTAVTPLISAFGDAIQRAID